jgi:cytidylate kinase
LARRLGWRFLDTGAMYRVVTLAALRDRIDLESEDSLVALVDQLQVDFPDDGTIRLNGEDVSQSIRDVSVTRASRYVADCPSVRRKLVAWQRDFARSQPAEGGVVTEGRDQGTIVFPDALCKFFLTASDETRAKRRLAEYQAKGSNVSLEEVLRDQRARDERDATRSIAPMKPAKDAQVIDSTGLSLEDVVDLLASRIGRLLEDQDPRCPEPSGSTEGVSSERVGVKTCG